MTEPVICTNNLCSLILLDDNCPLNKYNDFINKTKNNKIVLENKKNFFSFFNFFSFLNPPNAQPINNQYLIIMGLDEGANDSVKPIYDQINNLVKKEKIKNNDISKINYISRAFLVNTPTKIFLVNTTKYITITNTNNISNIIQCADYFIFISKNNNWTIYNNDLMPLQLTSSILKIPGLNATTCISNNTILFSSDKLYTCYDINKIYTANPANIFNKQNIYYPSSYAEIKSCQIYPHSNGFIFKVSNKIYLLNNDLSNYQIIKNPNTKCSSQNPREQYLIDLNNTINEKIKNDPSNIMIYFFGHDFIIKTEKNLYLYSFAQSLDDSLADSLANSLANTKIDNFNQILDNLCKNINSSKIKIYNNYIYFYIQYKYNNNMYKIDLINFSDRTTEDGPLKNIWTDPKPINFYPINNSCFYQ